MFKPTIEDYAARTRARCKLVNMQLEAHGFDRDQRQGITKAWFDAGWEAATKTRAHHFPGGVLVGAVAVALLAWWVR